MHEDVSKLVDYKPRYSFVLQNELRRACIVHTLLDGIDIEIHRASQTTQENDGIDIVAQMQETGDADLFRWCFKSIANVAVCALRLHGNANFSGLQPPPRF